MGEANLLYADCKFEEAVDKLLEVTRLINRPAPLRYRL